MARGPTKADLEARVADLEEALAEAQAALATVERQAEERLVAIETEAETALEALERQRDEAQAALATVEGDQRRRLDAVLRRKPGPAPPKTTRREAPPLPPRATWTPRGSKGPTITRQALDGEGRPIGAPVTTRGGTRVDPGEV
jgi:hypothetical protein